MRMRAVYRLSLGLPLLSLAACQKGDWKLVYRMRTRRLELYNLSEDIGEEHDLATVHPEIVQRLASELGTRLRQSGAPMPVVRSTGEAVPFPNEL